MATWSEFEEQFGEVSPDGYSLDSVSGHTAPDGEAQKLVVVIVDPAVRGYKMPGDVLMRLSIFFTTEIADASVEEMIDAIHEHAEAQLSADGVRLEDDGAIQ